MRAELVDSVVRGTCARSCHAIAVLTISMHCQGHQIKVSVVQMRGEEGGSSAITEADMQVFIASEQEDSNGTQQTAADGSEGDQQSQSLVCPVAGCNFLGKGNNPKGALDSHISSKHDQQHRRYREQQQRAGLAGTEEHRRAATAC